MSSKVKYQFKNHTISATITYFIQTAPEQPLITLPDTFVLPQVITVESLYDVVEFSVLKTAAYSKAKYGDSIRLSDDLDQIINDLILEIYNDLHREYKMVNGRCVEALY